MTTFYPCNVLVLVLVILATQRAVCPNATQRQREAQREQTVTSALRRHRENVFRAPVSRQIRVPDIFGVRRHPGGI